MTKWYGVLLEPATVPTEHQLIPRAFAVTPTTSQVCATEGHALSQTADTPP